jgi:hypothetical protein
MQKKYIVTIMSDYRRGLGCWMDLLTTYTFATLDYTLQITDTYKLMSSIYYSLH